MHNDVESKQQLFLPEIVRGSVSSRNQAPRIHKTDTLVSTSFHRPSPLTSDPSRKHQLLTFLAYMKPLQGDNVRSLFADSPDKQQDLRSYLREQIRREVMRRRRLANNERLQDIKETAASLELADLPLTLLSSRAPDDN